MRQIWVEYMDRFTSLNTRYCSVYAFDEDTADDIAQRVIREIQIITPQLRQRQRDILVFGVKELA